MDNIFENRIKDRIDGLNLERKSIVVLKGIPLSVVLKDSEYCVDLEKAIFQILYQVHHNYFLT